MIDLHLHLDGSLSEEDFIFLAKKQHFDLGKEFPKNIYVPEDCPSLEDYLTRFDLPLALLQTPDALQYATKSLVKRLADLGFIYAEIRYAPLLHMQKGMSQLDAAKAALKGLEDGLKENKDFDANLILCCMRHADEATNMETIEVANILKNTKVVAVDLAGAEAMHPCSYYSNIFNKAVSYGLNITIHGGEATGSDEIMMAIDNGAKRIGHGVHLSLDNESINKVKENDICFEFCPLSNLQTKSLKTFTNVPLREFMKNNIAVTINSDNMTVSNTTAINEMKTMVKTFSLSKDNVKMLLMTSIKYSFTSNDVKEQLYQKLNDKFETYWNQIN